jgi:H+/Cl- antiporter ClcA
MTAFRNSFARAFEKWKQGLISESDFRPTVGIVKLSFLAAVIGFAAAVIAFILYHLIGLVTNIAFYHRFAFTFVPPSGGSPKWAILIAPVVGGLIVGLMAKYGSERIRGHGIPEALEAILFQKSMMTFRVAILKPLSAAIAIGTGGPFGAEGPIIMTGGAVGSLFGQFFYLTSMERRTLLVAGAAAGMSATFATPIAATLLAVELLLFEMRPRSTIPVAIACFMADVLRPYLIGPGPLFPLHLHFQMSAVGWCLAAASGIFAALLGALLTAIVYKAEDGFNKLPVHWMWWPAIGAVAVGLGGYFEPHALGVGYNTIREILTGKFVGIGLLAFMVAKSFMWAIYLGSGTSGGVLAPLLVMGAGLGGIESLFFAGASSPLAWPLISMGAILASVMRVPFTAILFALELTHNVSLLPALLIACTVAYEVSVFIMKRSILTEKVARRGFDIFREYSVDLLEHIYVHDVMTKEVMTVPGDIAIKDLADQYFGAQQKYRAYPVVDNDGRALGIIDRSRLSQFEEASSDGSRKLADLLAAEPPPIVAYPNEICREVAIRESVEKLDRLPVVTYDGRQQLLGMITRYDLLKPYTQIYYEEKAKERFFRHGGSRPNKPDLSSGRPLPTSGAEPSSTSSPDKVHQ